MAPRAYWKGFLRLSLVTCPIALYPATSDADKVSFNQINKNTGHRIKYMKVDAESGDEVENDDIIKGYPIDKDNYIQVTKDELENIALESTRTIDIDEFVNRDDIDTRYLIRPYYLVPDGKVGHDAFAVIRETIRKMDMVAIGRVVLTSREHIIGLEPLGKGSDGHLDPLSVRGSRGKRILRRNQRRESYEGHAQPSRAHRKPKEGGLRSRKVRGPLRRGVDRTYQGEATGQSYRSQATTAR